MIETNLTWLEAELLEQLKFFDGWENLTGRHRHNLDGDTFFDEIEVNGKKYSFTNKLKYNNELEQRRYEKRFSKLSLYNAVSSYTGQTLPWGALTGIRPVKYAYGEGDAWREVMGGQMGVEQNKLDLVQMILEAQKPYYNTDNFSFDLFISVPFCPSRCMYCSFISNVVSKEKMLDLYVDCIVREIEESKRIIKNLRSVYIGGGTPTCLPIGLLEKILQAVGKVDCEFTVEAGRPDAINEEILALLKKYNVTRICVNPQTFLDRTLNLIGRKHTAQDIEDKFLLAKKFGFDINMDLIAGLPGESVEDFKYSIDKAVSLSPDDITVHTLSLKKGSILKETVDRLPSGDIGEMLNYSAYKLINNGFYPYYMYRQKYMAGNMENTGYAKKGKECVYNIDVMEEITCNIACGANGVSKKISEGGEVIERYGSPKDIKTYVEKIDKIIEEKNIFYKK